MVRRTGVLAVAVSLVVGCVGIASAVADPPEPAISGALFTSDASGNPVNLNLYASKQDVYLNGGPGFNAPDDAAGLPAGTYTFMVTDPSGKTLLSTDALACRQVTVDASGVFSSVAPSGACAHVTGASTEDNGLTVQLFPFNDTPNNGGVYKVWITLTADLDCTADDNKHCFVPARSKTDNFKVRSGTAVEIDTRFMKANVSGFLDNKSVKWTDTLGASNRKHTEFAVPMAHVEAPEVGTHKITIRDQAGCIVDDAYSVGKTYYPTNGSVTVPVTVKNHSAGNATYYVTVHCAP